MYLLNKDLSGIKLRKEQDDCLDFIFDKLHHEKIKKFFLLDLPTGVGKSILALSFIKRYLKEIDKDAKFDVLTESKILQRQYSQEFNSISNLWGRNTYQCSQFNCSCEQGKEFQQLTKQKCELCPYDEDREQFMGGKISLTNFHMFTLMQLNGLLNRRSSNILIVDEAHQLESVVSDFISVTLSPTMIKQVGLDDESPLLKRLKTINDIDSFVNFCHSDLLQSLESKKGEYDNELKGKSKKSFERDLKISNMFGMDSKSAEKSKKIEKINSLLGKIRNFLKEYKEDNSNWVIQIEYDKKKNKKVVVQPIWSHPFMKKYIWDSYDKVIMMSGTILDENMFTYLNGIPKPLSVYYNINSPFLIKNRPIYYMPLGKMTYTKKEETFKKYIPYIKKLLNKYSTKKGIIHTNSFELQKWVTEQIETDRFLTHDSDQKTKNFILKHHYEVKKPTVIVSPSMGTGVDLKNNRARFQICIKIPYPSLGDAKNKRRLKDNPEWYNWMTVSKLIQMYGRAVRNNKDSAHFIILDSSFSDVLRHSGKYFPDWIVKAIKTVNV
jgi:Rad3-related DNA helicase